MGTAGTTPGWQYEILGSIPANQRQVAKGVGIATYVKQIKNTKKLVLIFWCTIVDVLIWAKFYNQQKVKINILKSL